MNITQIICLIIFIICIIIIIFIGIYGRKIAKEFNYDMEMCHKYHLWDVLISDIDKIDFIEKSFDTCYFNYANRYTIIVFHASDPKARFASVFNKDRTKCLISDFTRKESKELAEKLMFRAFIF